MATTNSSVVSARPLALVLVGVLGLLLLGALLWFVSAALTTFGLLDFTPFAQRLFIELIATLQTSGTVIIILIGVALAGCSLFILLCWPGGPLWQRSNALLRGLLLVGFLLALLARSLPAAWGAFFWWRGLLYANLPATPDWAIIAAALASGALLGCLPEWLWRQAAGLVLPRIRAYLETLS